MLTIRLQRTGRKGYASFRVVVQDSRFSPSSGRVVAQLGHYNPHTKEVKIDKEKAEQYLKNGAQPTQRVVRLLEAEKVSLPSWVKKTTSNKNRNIRNPEKLRKHQPKEETPIADEPIEAAEKAEDTEMAEASEAKSSTESQDTVAEDVELAEEIAEVIVEEAAVEIAEELEKAVEQEAEKIVEEAEVEAEEKA